MRLPDHTQSPVGGRATRESSAGRVAGFAARHERALWALVVLACVGDVALTALGLHRGLAEGNPAVHVALEAGGLGGLALAKAPALAVGVTVRWRWPRRATLVPLGLALPWLVACGVNATLLA